MTKLAIMSDLHIDLNQFGNFEKQSLVQTLQKNQVTHLHLAGDISNHFQTISLPFLEELGQYFTVTYNLGNHDMLDLNEKDIEQVDFQTYTFGNTSLLAFHGWYDYSFYPQKTQQQNYTFKQNFWFDRRLSRPLSDPELTDCICRKLDERLAGLSGRIIVAMHFVPHKHFLLTHEKFRPFNAFLGSQKFHAIFKKYSVTDVVFGHAHYSYGEQIIDGITYHSHPLGYIREWDLTIQFVNQHPQYNPTGTWNLSKRYNAVKKEKTFQDYKQQQLAQEFQQSMTLFNL